MRRVLRGAIPLLAAALGFTRPASAQFALPADPAVPAPTIFAAADDQAAPLPRVVPPRRIVLEPMKEPSDAKAPATKPAVDLFAPTAASPGARTWAIPAHVLVAPSGLPGVAPAGAPAPAPSSTAATTAVTLHPQTATAPPARVWPAAFLVCKESEVTDVKQAAHSESADDLAPPPWENAEAPAVASVRRRIEAAYGRQVTGMAAETQSNGVVVVRVWLRSAAADPNRGKIIELPQAPGSGVRVLLEVGR